MKRPNVLWLMSDQHNASCTGYAGNPNVKTPAIDSIAGDGVEFTQAFCNNPICSPSRISFMTGQTCNHHRMMGNRHSMWPAPQPRHAGLPVSALRLPDRTGRKEPYGPPLGRRRL